jgi:hypothetical protein
MCNFLQVQGNQGIARRQTPVSRTSDFIDLSAFGVALSAFGVIEPKLRKRAIYGRKRANGGSQIDR